MLTLAILITAAIAALLTSLTSISVDLVRTDADPRPPRGQHRPERVAARLEATA